METQLSHEPRRTDEEPVGLPIEPAPAPVAPEVAAAPSKILPMLSRCPYCREDVRSERADWVACEGCLARHHTSCWTERGSCASCHGRGALRRGGSRRRFFPAAALLGILTVVGAGVLGLRAASDLSLAQPTPSTVSVSLASGPFQGGNARDDALLGLGFLSQTSNRQFFMERMVASAARYDALGKPKDGQLIRDVASLALEQGTSAAFAFLRGDPALKNGKVVNDSYVTEVRLEERKLALELKVQRTNDDKADRVKWGRALLDIAARYRRVGAPGDAARVEQAAEAIASEEVTRAWKLLRADEAEAPGLDGADAKDERGAGDAFETEARERLTQIMKGLAREEVEIPVVRKLLVGARDGYRKANLGDDADRMVQAIAAVDAESPHKALKLLAVPETHPETK